MHTIRKYMLITLTAAGALMLSAASLAEGSTSIYKWVDKTGETHFSQLPPKHGEAQVINPDYATSDDEGSANDSLPADTSIEKKQSPSSDKPVLAINKAEAEKACKEAKVQIKMLQNPQNQLMTQDADGKYRPLSAKEIAERLKQAQDVANKACIK